MDSDLAGSAAPVALSPVVVAVLVTFDPGPWFDDVVSALAAQDYPNLTVIVVDCGGDAAGEPDTAARVAAALPGAFVRRLGHNPGFGPAANEVVRLVEGASFYCFLHDDCAPSPDAITNLVDEAIRSNAGIVGPKLVWWDDPTRLRSVGLDVDALGHVSTAIEFRELDQEQHDALTDVFALSGAMLLVRADLFAELQGFEPTIELVGEDVDLCWRAQLAGARVLVVPAARARHLGDLGSRVPHLELLRLETAHRLLMLRTLYAQPRRSVVLTAAGLSVWAEATVLRLRRRSGDARQLLAGWRRRSTRDDIERRRAQVEATRRLDDHEVTALQLSAWQRVSRALRGVGASSGVRGAVVVRAVRTRIEVVVANRVARVAGIGFAAVFLFASRSLISSGVPAVGQFGAVRASFTALLSNWAHGRNASGVAPLAWGAPRPAVIGFLGAISAGSVEFARTWSVIGLLPLGWWGMWRLVARIGSPWSALVATGVYAGLALAPNALAQGHWDALVAYGIAPWVAALMAAASNGEGQPRRTFLVNVARLTVLIALALAGSLMIALVVVIVAVAMEAGAIGGGDGRNGRAVMVSGLALMGAAVLHLPYVGTVIAHGRWSIIGGVKPAGAPGRSLSDLLAFHTGPVGASALGLAVLVPAAFVLITATGLRLSWAVRSAVMIIMSIALAVTVEHGVLQRAIGSPELVLVPAGMGLAVLAGLAVATFHHDVRGQRLTFRQPMAALSALACVVAIVPVLPSLIGGRWQLPTHDHDTSLAGLADARTLWIGDPTVLPVAGWWLADGLALAVTASPHSDITTSQVVVPTEADHRVGEALNLVGKSDSDLLGHLLAPIGIRYVVVVDRLGPSYADGVVHLVPPSLLETLVRQRDLTRLDSDPSLTVYENAVAIPAIARLRGATAAASATATPAALVTSELTDAGPIGSKSREARAGSDPLRVEVGDVIYLARPFGSAASVAVDGVALERQPAFGWSQRYDVVTAGDVSVRTPSHRWLVMAGLALLWLLAAAFALGRYEPDAKNGNDRDSPIEAHPDVYLDEPVDADADDGLAAWGDVVDR